MYHMYKGDLDLVPSTLSHLHVLQQGSLIKNKVQHTAVLQLSCDFIYILDRGYVPLN